MTGQTRKELLSLIDALCEDTASESERARLEELVLSDASACSLYVAAMELHGQLYWDAAGLGAMEDAVPAKPGTSPFFSRRRQAAGAALLAAVAAVLAVGFLWRQPAIPHVAGPQQQLDSAQSVQLAETPPQPEPIPLPDVKLPSLSAQPESSRAGDRSRTTVRSGISPVLVDARSDSAVIAFIDQQLQATWADYEVTPAAVAEDAEWLRRIYLDLIGRIPTTQEAERFIQDQRSDKRERQADMLLASDGYANHLASVWTNLLVGRTRDGQIHRSTLYAWLQREFATNRSWRETVTDLVTARGSAADSGPANFLLAHLNNQAVPATAITARILLCEQLQCAQCHQHPVAKEWGQERFWELNAFFQQAQVKEYSVVDAETGQRTQVRELVDAENVKPTYYETLQGVMRVAFPRFAGVEVTADQPVSLRDQLAQLLFAEDSPQPARAFVNRTWSMLFGYGLTSPVDDMGPHTPVSHPELLEGLSRAFIDSGYNVRRLTRWICLSRAYQLSSVASPLSQPDSPETGERPLFSRMYVKPLTAEQLFDSLLVASGIAPAELLGQQMSARREAWLQQFYTAVETEENGEASTFDGTLPQALMMMNGELTRLAMSSEPGHLLADIAARPGTAEADKIRQLSLAALGRYPTNEELLQVRDILRRQIRQRTERNVPPQVALTEGLRDVYWAYLNSSEFAVNH